MALSARTLRLRACLCFLRLLYLGHLGVRATDLAVDIHRRLHLHRVGPMTVDIQRERCVRVSLGSRQGLASTPLFRVCVAKVCRRSWNRIDGNSKS